MIEIVLSACFLQSPFNCQERTIPLAEGVSQFQCLLFSQPILAEWQQSHPNVRIEKYDCQPAGQYAKL